MKEKIIQYITAKMEKDPHYLVKVSEEIGLSYSTTYKIVKKLRGGNADSLEKMWLWYEKENRRRK